MVDPKQTAFLIIDMQNGFIDRASGLCIESAEATVPLCAKALDRARALGMPVFYIRREYASDGSNVEAARFASWKAGGRPVSSAWPGSSDFPKPLAPQEGDRVITKTRYSAFHRTSLAEEFDALGVDTFVATGTTTPNCIRATCVDGLSLNYNVAIIEDCTSSRTPEVQAANIEDMMLMGVQVIGLEAFCETGLESIQDIEALFHAALVE